MDPISQGVLGGVAGQQVSSRTEKVAALVAGGLAGMAADLDVLISSNTDPLLFLEFHRHFTHALVFIPFGALICALFFRFIFKAWFGRLGLSFKRLYLFCFAGYATHAVLDACTTYGTQLLWPFSDMRVAWNNVSVVDPLFTIPLIALLVLSVVKKSQAWATISALYVFAYLGFGVLQGRFALSEAQQLAEQRGHVPIQLGVKPSFANLLVWKSVYQHEGRYYVDAIRVGRSSKVYQGVSVQKLDLAQHFPWLDATSQQAKDIERFRWFSNQHLALDPENSQRIIDVRYSLIPNQVTGMWGIELNAQKGKSEHVVWTSNRPAGAEASARFKELWQMLIGK